MVLLLGTVRKEIIKTEKMKICQIPPPANRNLQPANRVKNMKKLRRNSPFAGLKVNPWDIGTFGENIHPCKIILIGLDHVLTFIWNVCLSKHEKSIVTHDYYNSCRASHCQQIQHTTIT